MEYLTIEEVSQILKTHTNTVYKMCRRGVLPSVKIGKEWRISKDRLAEFMDVGVKRMPQSERAVPQPGLEPGHLMVVCSNEQEVWNFEAEFFASMAHQQYFLFKACWWQKPEQVRQQLQSSGIPVERLESRGEMAIADLGEIFLTSGPEAAAEAWRLQARSAQERGFKGMVGSGSPKLDCCGTVDRLCRFEGTLHDSLKGLPVRGFCTYPLGEMKGDDWSALIRLFRVHDKILFRSGAEEVEALVRLQGD
jgi:excisionase family DNA binding protein